MKTREEAIRRIVHQSIGDVATVLDVVGRVLDGDPPASDEVHAGAEDVDEVLLDSRGEIIAYLIRKRLAALPLDDAAPPPQEDFK